jgi:hypothetical protein
MLINSDNMILVNYLDKKYEINISFKL